MTYIPLRLGPPDSPVAAAISMATERHLSQAHYLLAAVHTPSDPQGHFGHSVVTMLLLTIAAASAIRNFDPRRNKNSHGDAASFKASVQNYFPWQSLIIIDFERRPNAERISIAAEELYTVFRNPIVHCGGAIGKGNRKAEICHIFPGSRTAAESERAIAELCEQRDSSGYVLLELMSDRSKVHTRALYWSVRRMIETMAEDPQVQKQIRARLCK